MPRLPCKTIEHLGSSRYICIVMDSLDDILRRYTVSDPSADADGKLLGASFIVLKDHGVLCSREMK